MPVQKIWHQRHQIWELAVLFQGKQTKRLCCLGFHRFSPGFGIMVCGNVFEIRSQGSVQHRSPFPVPRFIPWLRGALRSFRAGSTGHQLRPPAPTRPHGAEPGTTHGERRPQASASPRRKGLWELWSASAASTRPARACRPHAPGLSLRTVSGASSSAATPRRPLSVGGMGGKGHGTTPHRTTAPGVHCAAEISMGREGWGKMAAAKQSRREG